MITFLAPYRCGYMEKIIKEYIETGCSIQHLKRKYGIPPMKISNAIKAAGYEVINKQNQIKFDEHIFDKIDTEEKAYWLGFIWADGNIAKRDYCFEMSLAEKDKEHLQKFNDFIKHIRPIKEKKCKLHDKTFIAYRVSFNSKHFWNTLNNYGCVPNKSLTLKFPDLTVFENKDLVNHFIRGYFDGDGCISHCNKTHTKIAFILCGTTEMLNTISTILGKPNCKLQSKPNTKCMELCFNHFTALSILHKIYNNASIYLKRKYQLYKEYCRVYEELYTLSRGKIGEGCDANTEQIIDISKGSMAA